MTDLYDPFDGDARARSTADLVARRSYGRLVAFLAARTHDVRAAEDALSDAFAAALMDWPRNGCPSNPEAWLLTVARRKLLDVARRAAVGDAVLAHVQRLTEVLHVADDVEIPDRRLALLFACAHPAIDVAVRAPLMLQAVVGLDAQTIASAFLTSPSAMSKRLVRAKQKIREAGIPFRVPQREELPERLDVVLDAIYAAFAEGWTDPAGVDVVRRELTSESLFLARLVVELLPDAPEALGMLAVMLHVDARRAARRDDAGDYVPFAEQNPGCWDWPTIREAESLLGRASTLGTIGRYQIEAAIQSAHVHRRVTGQANWDAIVQLYDVLSALTASPVAAINRALAVAESLGAEAGLAAIRAITDRRLAEYQPYWAAQAELLTRTGSHTEARHAYDMAIGLERDPAVRRFLQRRAARRAQS